MAGDIIKEFLVKLGFQIDEDGVKKFQAGVASVTKEVTGLGLKAAGAATAVTAAITKIAEQYEDLYFASIRTNASAAALTTFAYGSKAIGISAEQSASSLERLNVAIQSNPGQTQLLHLMGIQTAGKDTKEIFNSLIDTLAKMPPYLAIARAASFGISPSELLQRIRLRKEETAAEADHARKMVISGVSIDELTKKSHDYDQSLRSLEHTIGLVWDQTANHWLPSMTTTVTWLNSITESILDVGRATGGWSSDLVSLTAALGGLASFSWLLGLLGFGGAAGATGLLAGVGVIVGGAAATVGALIVPTNNSDEADLYKRNPKTGQMEPTAAGSSGLAGGGTGAGGAAGGGYRKKILEYFMSQGWSKEAASGIVANLQSENSKFDPHGVGDEGQAYGIAQWHPDRQRDFKAFSGKDIRNSTLEEQLAFVNYELTKGKEQNAGNKLRGATSAAQAGSIGSMLYERPGAVQEAALNRARLAKNIFDTDLTPAQGQGGGGTAVTQHNTITITGVSDPKVAADHVNAGLSTWADATRTAGVTVR